MFSNHACFCLFQMFASNMHQNEWIQVRFFKHFLGRGSPSPLPRPLPRFFSDFALNAQALRAFDSGFALDSRALRPLDSGFALNFRVENLIWPPPNKLLDPPLCHLRHLTSSAFQTLHTTIETVLPWECITAIQYNTHHSISLLTSPHSTSLHLTSPHFTSLRLFFTSLHLNLYASWPHFTSLL